MIYTLHGALVSADADDARYRRASGLTGTSSGGSSCAAGTSSGAPGVSGGRDEGAATEA